MAATSTTFVATRKTAKPKQKFSPRKFEVGNRVCTTSGCGVVLDVNQSGWHHIQWDGGETNWLSSIATLVPFPKDLEGMAVGDCFICKKQFVTITGFGYCKNVGRVLPIAKPDGVIGKRFVHPDELTKLPLSVRKTFLGETKAVPKPPDPNDEPEPFLIYDCLARSNEAYCDVGIAVRTNLAVPVVRQVLKYLEAEKLVCFDERADTWKLQPIPPEILEASDEAAVTEPPPSQESSTAKAISLHQPWASLIALGRKHYETRSWKTSYRGKLLICAAKKRPSQAQLNLFGLSAEDAPLGVAVAIADLVDCLSITSELAGQISLEELKAGNWTVGRYAWKLENITPIHPVPVRGKQGLWNVDLTQ
ncbi:MAG: ASCH domain-containing protein, partial [Cyanobacteriota bacterium]